MFKIVDNKLTNLISIINPGLNGESGIKAAILYRVGPCIEIDSSDMLRKTYKEFYGDNIPDSADTIFNAFIPLLDFCRVKLMLLKSRIPKDKKDLLLLIYLHMDEIFREYGELRFLFDRYFDLMYSFSNMMPVPKNFNGSRYHKGKGTWELNKDYPSLYYKNLEDISSEIHNREYMKKWLDEVMDKYHIRKMYELKPPYDGYYGYDDENLEALKLFVKEASDLIMNRFCE